MLSPLNPSCPLLAHAAAFDISVEEANVIMSWSEEPEPWPGERIAFAGRLPLALRHKKAMCPVGKSQATQVSVASGMFIEIALGIFLVIVLLILLPFASLGLLAIVPVIVGVYVLLRWPGLGWFVSGGIGLAVFYELGRNWSEKRSEKKEQASEEK